MQKLVTVINLKKIYNLITNQNPYLLSVVITVKAPQMLASVIEWLSQVVESGLANVVDTESFWHRGCSIKLFIRQVLGT